MTSLPMHSVLSGIADYLVRQSWQILLVFGLVLVASWGLRKASAHVRYLVWLVVIAKCFMPPLIGLPLAVLPLREVIQADPKPVSDSLAPLPADAGVIRSVGDSQARSIPAPEASAARPLSTATATISESKTHFSLRQWMVLAWMAVVAAVLANICRKAWVTHRWLKGALLPAGAELCQLADEVAHEIGMRAPPTVYLLPAIAQPFVWGWLRGRVYFPAELAASGSAEPKRALLAHELAHVSRWDAAVNNLQILAQAIFWFHPLIWWANKKIRQERENCCDEIVLAGSRTRPKAYCEAIVEILELELKARSRCPGLAVTGSAKNLHQRIASILTPGRHFCRRPSIAAVVALVLVAACVLPTSLLLTSRAGQPQPATPGERTTTTQPWRPGQVMEVRVVNARTQEALPGVQLELQNAGPGIDFGDVKTQTTDADGRSLVKLPALPPNAVRVYPSKPGFVPLRVFWDDEPAPVMPKTVTIPLEPGKVIGGTIVNEAGRPIPNVAVNVHYWATGLGKNPHLRANIDVDVKSDENGRWRVDVAPATIEMDRLRIFVNHPDYVSDHLQRGISPYPVTEQPKQASLYDQTAVMTMRAGATIQGQVTDKDGRPIANAKIYDRDYYWFEPGTPRATSDRDGTFSMSGVKWPESSSAEHNRLKLTVHADGFAPELVEVDRSNATANIQLSPAKTIRGRVVDWDGKPIEGVDVSVSSWRNQNKRLYLETTSAADGVFRLTGVPIDEVKYNFRKDGYMMVEGFPMSRPADQYMVMLKTPVKVSGAVVDADTGQPLEKFSLVRGTDYGDGQAPFWLRWNTETRVDGRYDTTINQEGHRWLFRVEADGYMPAESRIFKAYDPDAGELTYDFKLRKAPPVTGSVLGLDGKPLGDADVYLATERLNISHRNDRSYRGDNRTVKTDQNGRFEFPPEVEPYCLVVVHEQGIAMTTETEFKSSQPLVLQPWTEKNQSQQIIRRPAPGQYVSFPVPAAR